MPADTTPARGAKRNEINPVIRGGDAQSVNCPERMFLRQVTFGFCLLAVGIGLSLLIGGQPRVSGPTFSSVREIGGPYVWGSAILAQGLAMTTFWTAGLRTAMGWVLALGTATYFAFAAQFAFAAYYHPEAALTGVVSYIFIGAAHAGLAPMAPVRQQSRG